MTTSIWLDINHAPTDALSADTTCDVVVIGGGICGTSAALALAEQGVDVVLLEGAAIASSATGRNAGFILQGTAERYSRAAALMGRDRARAVHAMTLENHRQMRDAVERYDIHCEYRCRGSLQLAGSEQEEQELLESAALLEEDGFQARVVDASGLSPALQKAGFKVGVHLPQDGEVHPVRFVRGVADAARRAGARVFENTHVSGLDASTPGEVVAHTSSGKVHASLAVVATNARAGELLPFFADKVDPVRGQMLGTGPAPVIFECPIYADHGFDYWRQDEAGRLALGGWRNLDPENERGIDDVLHDDIQEKMTAFVRRFPELADVEITHRWSGIMGFSRDGLPLVGPAPGMPGAVAGVGFTGHGFGFAFAAGRGLAEVVLSGESAVTALLGPSRLT